MKICLILEGSYPYVHGGVSTWMHEYIQKMPEQEFCLWVIGAHAADRGRFVYDLPPNVTGVQEVFLDDALRMKEADRDGPALSDGERQALRELIRCGHPDWNLLFDWYQNRQADPMATLRSEEFLETLTALCLEEHPYAAFADTFHTVRSMLLPVLYLLTTPVPQADCYHAICTGYGGLLAALGAWKHRAPLLLTEHGIYTREREEEIIRAKWVQPAFKDQWIRFFYMLSEVIYSRAQGVTSLFASAMRTQIELGCDAARCRIIANGIDFERMAAVPPKPEDGRVDIGAVVRMAPIKDIKTMIYAFYELRARRQDVRLHILGGVDDAQYDRECRALVAQLGLTDSILFPGRVDIVRYFEKLDFTLLTSISEGQPLSVLESLAACRPCVTTDVGCCRALLEGEPGDDLGVCGLCVPPMYREGLADAMERLCRSRALREQMGRIGRQRVDRYYRHERMLEQYRELYREVQHCDGGCRV